MAGSCLTATLLTQQYGLDMEKPPHAREHVHVARPGFAQENG